MSYKNIVIIPTYNERENIKILIPLIFKLIPTISIIVADDNSPDDTAIIQISLLFLDQTKMDWVARILTCFCRY